MKKELFCQIIINVSKFTQNYIVYDRLILSFFKY